MNGCVLDGHLAVLQLWTRFKWTFGEAPKNYAHAKYEEKPKVDNDRVQHDHSDSSSDMSCGCQISALLTLIG